MTKIIKVENISKAYQLGEFGTGTISRDLERFWARMRGKDDPFLKIGEINDRTKKGGSDVVWSLKDINFDVEQGDAVGIIGRNGAGKSTLLKILSRVTSPTTGSVKVKGRIASLLEVGTGFHPELTGKENIYLNGAILGMRKAEIKRKFDEIVDFAGIERYVDTPVKRYSSGMYVRLAFAVAAHLESEILIVDEVLAVGDAEFQKKCLGKMGDVSKGEGRTVLFVSHNMDSIMRLCSKSILLNSGQIRSQGLSEDIIKTYLNNEAKLSSYIEYTDPAIAPGNNIVKLLRSEVIDHNSNNQINFNISDKIGIKITFCVLQETADLIIGFNLFTQTDVHILSSHDTVNTEKKYLKGTYDTVVWLPANLLSEGIHYCGIAAMSYKPFTVHFHDINKFVFNIQDLQIQTEDSSRGIYTGNIPGAVRPKLTWDLIS
ncbi:MAG TPA: polysaccharide ABC transporter ATP-binding protein [Mucilaginibacter sp.]|jgi:lipopolysaccharide transport system ATP-binding protein